MLGPPATSSVQVEVAYDSIVAPTVQFPGPTALEAVGRAAALQAWLQLDVPAGTQRRRLPRPRDPRRRSAGVAPVPRRRPSAVPPVLAAAFGERFIMRRVVSVRGRGRLPRPQWPRGRRQCRSCLRTTPSPTCVRHSTASPGVPRARRDHRGERRFHRRHRRSSRQVHTTCIRRSRSSTRRTVRPATTFRNAAIRPRPVSSSRSLTPTTRWCPAR